MGVGWQTGIGSGKEDVEELAGAKGAGRARGKVVQQTQQRDDEHRAVETRAGRHDDVRARLLLASRHLVCHGGVLDCSVRCWKKKERRKKEGKTENGDLEMDGRMRAFCRVVGIKHCTPRDSSFDANKNISEHGAVVRIHVSAFTALVVKCMCLS